MENVSTDFLESNADFTTLETQHIPFNLQATNSPEGDDEDEADDNNQKEDDDQGGDKTKSSDDDNPPIDKDVVHSPLTTQPGGKPGG